MTTSTATTPPDAPTRRRVALASCLGTAIEFYDFLIYGTAAALVFPKLFFPALGTTAALVASFATFGVAFLARPLGGIVFGHYGDRIGRKRTLMVTLLMMGLSTLFVGLLPTAATIGVAAPILLVALRVVQGFAVGGEWAGAVLLATEYSPREQRGAYAIFPQLGPPIAFTLTSATFLVTSLTLGDTDARFLAFGWRIPFLLSLVLVVVGLYVRLRIEETPVYRAAARIEPVRDRRLPFVSVLREQAREVVVGSLVVTAFFALFYIATAFLTSYGTDTVHGPGLPRTAVLGMGVVSGVFFAAAIVAGGVASDRVGRKRVVLVGNVALVAVGLALFPIIDVGTTWSFGVGLCLAVVVLGVIWGAVGPLLSEMFTVRHRYTGASACYNVAAILGGAMAPIVAAWLLADHGSTALGWMIAVPGVVSVLATLLLSETRGRDLVADPVATSPDARVEALAD
jgi:MFS family permease